MPRAPAPRSTPAPPAAATASKRSPRRPLAARLDDADWAFLEQQGVGNPSEALRAIITQARLSASAPSTVAEAQARLIGLIDASLNGLRTPPRSIVGEDILREACLIMATAQVGPPAPGFTDAGARQAFEAQIVDRAFDLLDAMLRHALTPHAAAWSPEVVRCRLAASKELLVSALSAVARDNPVSSNGGKP